MSTDLLLPTTELDAVNAILSTIGEAPVATLSGVLPVDAATARALLHTESRTLQKSGWSFNIDYGFRLTPDVNGEIILPANTLKVNAPDDPDLVERSRKLYDTSANTFAIGRAVTVDIVRGLAFDHLPESARTLITLMAGRKFQNRILGDDVLTRISDLDIRDARAQFLSDEAEVAGHNVLRDSPTSSNILKRRH